MGEETRGGFGKFCCKSCGDVCGCNTSCCCCIKVPLGVGYVVCNLWLLLNGVAFPAVSFVFWPRDHIFYSSCVICGINVVFVCISFANMRFKAHKLFDAVVYGVFATYLAAGLMIIMSVSADLAGNSTLLLSSFKSHFGVSIHPSSAFRILQTVQIMFYTYLFASYVYCGFILQLYEISHDKRKMQRVEDDAMNLAALIVFQEILTGDLLQKADNHRRKAKKEQKLSKPSTGPTGRRGQGLPRGLP